MGHPPRGRSVRRTRKGAVLARLEPEEGARVLRALLERHPEFVPEAEEIARAMVADVDAEAVAESVEQAVLDLNIDDLGARAGRKASRYVDPTEAAWELLGEAVDPFLAEMKRHIDLGFEAAATSSCAGIVLGLYRCRGKNSDEVLGWAEDFPAETACQFLRACRDQRKGRRSHPDVPRRGARRMSITLSSVVTCIS